MEKKGKLLGNSQDNLGKFFHVILIRQEAGGFGHALHTFIV